MEMMRMKRVLTIFLLVGAMVALAGCEEPLGPKSNKGLRLEASTVSNSLATKTSYSDYFQELGENRYLQRINWTAGDHVRVFSENTDEVARATGLKPEGGYVFSTGNDKDYYDYIISNELTDDTFKHTAKLSTQGTEIGLAWTDKPSATAKVFGVFPEGTSERFNNDQLLAGFYDLTIPDEQSLSKGSPITEGTLTITPFSPDMSHAYMVAKPTPFETAEDGTPMAHLEFYPIFNAFEIQLQGADESETVIQSVTLSSTSSNLTGNYKYRYRDRNSNGDFTNWNTNKLSGLNREIGPKDSGIDYTGKNGSSITVTLPANTVISDKKAVAVTILTLPGKNTDTQNGVWLTDLTLTVKLGNGQEKSLALNYNNAPIKFNSFQKARITGLAMKGGAEWKLQVDALRWTLYEKETTFSQNIQSSPFRISNAKETGNNYYPAGTREYQVRTLDMDGGKTFFEVEFTPQAPLGGYWQLIPESHGGMGTAAFKVELWDEENDRPAGADLKGHIMNQPVKFHVTSNVTDAQRTEDHAIIIKAIFSTSITFDENSTFSADSEIQDVHRDGSFSYWRFVIPQKIN